MEHQQSTPSAPQFGQRSAGTPSGEPIDVAWRGSPWSLTGLSFLNFFLKIITLGIYSFWGKTEVRKRIWSSVRLNAEPLVYTGTGKELFLGFLIIFGLLLLPFILVVVTLQFMFGPEHWSVNAAVGVFYVIVFLLIGVAIYRARRYRLSRTNWRGIRGTLTGSAWGYSWSYIWTALLIVPTLGWIIPYRSHVLYKRMTNEQQFGTEQFSYDGDVGSIYARFAGIFFGGLALIIGSILFGLWMVGLSPASLLNPEAWNNLGDTIDASGQVGWLVFSIFFVYVVLGVVQVVYYTTITNYLIQHTTYSSARFDLKLTYLGMLWLLLSNIAIVLFSFTILQPVAMARASKYFVDHLAVQGTVDVERIVQNAAAMGTTGEGLAEAFDIDGL